MEALFKYRLPREYMSERTRACFVPWLVLIVRKQGCMLLLPRQIFNNVLLTAELIKSPYKPDLCTVLYRVLWGVGVCSSGLYSGTHISHNGAALHSTECSVALITQSNTCRRENFCPEQKVFRNSYQTSNCYEPIVLCLNLKQDMQATAKEYFFSLFWTQ